MIQHIFFFYFTLGCFFASIFLCMDVYFFRSALKIYQQFVFEKISQIIYQCIEWKVDIEMSIKKWIPKSNDMKIRKVELYGGQGMKKKDVTTKIKKMSVYNQELIEFLYKLEYGIDIVRCEDKKNVRLKIYYEFMQKEYIQYLSYETILKYEGEKSILKFPWIKKDSIELYRKDIVEPYFWEMRGKFVLYSLFMVECKNMVIYIKKRGEEMKEMRWRERDYIEKIKTPYQDFGILMNTPVRMSWILEENGIDREEVESWKMVYMNDYLDEELMELRKHEKESKNVEDCLVTERVMEIVKRKNGLFGRKLLE
jgi:hypothetical protein